MPLSPARSWTLFRAVRVLIYSLAILASIGIAAIYAVLLIRGWYSYSLDQRVIAIVLFVIYAFSTIMLYSMLIFQFRLWMDGARLAVLLLAQIGGTVAFDIFEATFPCSNLGSLSTCKTIETIAIFGGWSTAGLLLLFSLYLVSMHYVPVPSRRPNPETLLALQLVSEKKGTIYEKRGSMKSMASASSVYSQQSHITPYPYMAPSDTSNSRRSPSIPEGRRMPTNDQYRSRSPAYAQPSDGQYHFQTSAYAQSAGPSQGQYRPQTPAYMQTLESPKGQYRPQPSADSFNDQYRSQSPRYAQPTRHQPNPASDAQRLSPPFDSNRSRTPVSLLSGETAATAGSSMNRPAPTYDYRSKTPGPGELALKVNRPAPTYDYRSKTPGELGLNLDRPTPTYDYNHSRTLGSTGSAGSMGSAASQGSHSRKIPPPGSQRAVTPALSIRSASSIRTAPRQRYYQNNGIPAPKPMLAPERNYPPLTQAFTAPIISRHGTPMTSFSNTSFYVPERQPQLSTLSPPGSAQLETGYSFPQPPQPNYQNSSYTAPLKLNEKNRPKSPPNPIVQPVPVAVQLRDALMQTVRERTYSDATLRARSNTLSSVPRSPSPETVLFHNMPTTPLSAVLPARPDLSPALYIGRYGSPAPSEGQRQRLGSIPDINVTADSPVLGNEHRHEVVGDFRRETPNRNWVTSPPTPSENVTSVNHWREKLTGTPRPLES